MLSKLVEVTSAYISYIETGYEGMRFEIFMRISNALNASAVEIY